MSFSDIQGLHGGTTNDRNVLSAEANSLARSPDQEMKVFMGDHSDASAVDYQGRLGVAGEGWAHGPLSGSSPATSEQGDHHCGR